MKANINRTWMKISNRSRLIAKNNNWANPDMTLRYPYRNLVFKGGGIRGLAYKGTLEILEERGILPQIERVAGTSAGAITAMLVSLRLPFQTMMDVIKTLDYTKIPQTHLIESKTHEILASIGLGNGDLMCTSRLLNEYGWFSSLYFYEWLQDLIADAFDGNGSATFSDFRQHGFRDLYIIASNMNKRQAEIFSYETTPNVAVADAVRMSISIPLFFHALRFDGRNFGQGDLYVDGGLYDNFPIQIFDHERFAIHNPWYIKGINWETLGCYLYPYRSPEILQKDPQNLREFLGLTLTNLFDAYQRMSYDNSAIDQRRTIKINDCGISPIEFNIPVDSEKYNMLIESGRESTRNFLDEEFPTDIFA